MKAEIEVALGFFFLMCFWGGVVLLLVVCLVGVVGGFSEGKAAESERPIDLTVATMNRVYVLEVIDGDTIRGNIDLGYDVRLMDQRIRLEGFDAWEVSRIRQTVEVTDEEIIKGKKARSELARLIDDAEAVLLQGEKRGAYGRIEGYLRLVQPSGPTLSVEGYMIEHGHDRN